MGCGRPGEAPDPGISLQRSALREGIVEVGMLTGAIESVRFGNGAAGRSQGVESARNPFRMGSALSPGREQRVESGCVQGDAVWLERETASDVPLPGEAAEPLTDLTFVGFVEGLELDGRVVVFTDGEFVFYGRQGDVIDGRFRIVRFGLESVDLVAIDGQGEQTLRLQPENSGGL